MKIEKKIKKTVESFSAKDPKDLAEKINYSKRLENNGILKKKKYNLPHIDTIGKIFYNSVKEN